MDRSLNLMLIKIDFRGSENHSEYVQDLLRMIAEQIEF